MQTFIHNSSVIEKAYSIGEVT